MLEEEGLITTELYSNHPPRYRYTVTKSGEELEQSLIRLLFGEVIIYKNVINN